LEAVQNDIERQITHDLSRINERGAWLGGKSLERLHGLKKVIGEGLAEAHIALRRDLSSDLQERAKYQAEWAERLYSGATGITVNLERPSAALLQSIVTSRPFQGAILREWAAKMEKSQLERIGQGIRLGLTEGESTAEIVMRLTGSGALKYRDGQFARDKRGAEALVRTAANHVATQSHAALIDKNAKLFPKYRWVSILDRRTTPMCRSRDGVIYTTGEGPTPPGHWNCRSTIVYLSKIESAQQDWPTYGKWLARQSAETQDDILGKARGQLFRKGELPIDHFTNRKGGELTLEQLKTKESAAWEKAFGR